MYDTQTFQVNELVQNVFDVNEQEQGHKVESIIQSEA